MFSGKKVDIGHFPILQSVPGCCDHKASLVSGSLMETVLSINGLNGLNQITVGDKFITDIYLLSIYFRITDTDPEIWKLVFIPLKMFRIRIFAHPDYRYKFGLPESRASGILKILFSGIPKIRKCGSSDIQKSRFVGCNYKAHLRSLPIISRSIQLKLDGDKSYILGFVKTIRIFFGLEFSWVAWSPGSVL